MRSDGFPGTARATVIVPTRHEAGNVEELVRRLDAALGRSLAEDERYLLTRVATAYTSCWVYAGGRRGRRDARAAVGQARRDRVGTVACRHRLAAPGHHRRAELSREVLASAKHRGEHRFGIHSLIGVLTPFCSSLNVQAEPSVVQLANVAHLTTEVRGRLATATSLLELTASVHPAAVHSALSRSSSTWTAPVTWAPSAGSTPPATASSPSTTVRTHGRHVRSPLRGRRHRRDSGPATEAATPPQVPRNATRLPIEPTTCPRLRTHEITQLSRTSPQQRLSRILRCKATGTLCGRSSRSPVSPHRLLPTKHGDCRSPMTPSDLHGRRKLQDTAVPSVCRCGASRVGGTRRRLLFAVASSRLPAARDPTRGPSPRTPRSLITRRLRGWPAA